jgi:predicted NAD-dependent protein-ADP-ribosyltransferase YbiA (DUF1768 family)
MSSFRTGILGNLITSVCRMASCEKFAFFYGTESPFSQFHPCKFIVDGVTYSCAEQYMMHQKAGEHIHSVYRFRIFI